MMNKTWLAGGAGLALVVVGAVAVAFASDWGDHGWKDGRHRGGHGGRGSAARLLHYDANKDGTITRAEIDAGLAADFRAADSNNDGKLDAGEFHKYLDQKRAERKARVDAWRAKHSGQGREPSAELTAQGGHNIDPMKNMDWNLDGFITPDEFAGRVHTQAMRADRNGDGTISADEMKQHGRRVKGEKSTNTTPSAPTPPADAKPEE